MTDQTPGLSRRALLVATAGGVPFAALLTACQGVQALGTPPPPPHDVRVLAASITAEEHLVATCSAALAQLPPGATAALGAVRTVRAEHVAHLAQLKSRLIEPTTPTPAPSSSAPGPPAPQGSVASVLGALEQAEQAASDRLIGQLAGLPPALAQLFASIAASEATHVPFFQQAGQAP